MICNILCSRRTESPRPTSSLLRPTEREERPRLLPGLPLPPSPLRPLPPAPRHLAPPLHPQAGGQSRAGEVPGEGAQPQGEAELGPQQLRPLRQAQARLRGREGEVRSGRERDQEGGRSWGWSPLWRLQEACRTPGSDPDHLHHHHLLLLLLQSSQHPQPLRSVGTSDSVLVGDILLFSKHFNTWGHEVTGTIISNFF